MRNKSKPLVKNYKPDVPKSRRWGHSGGESFPSQYQEEELSRDRNKGQKREDDARNYKDYGRDFERSRYGMSNKTKSGREDWEVEKPSRKAFSQPNRLKLKKKAQRKKTAASPRKSSRKKADTRSQRR